MNGKSYVGPYGFGGLRFFGLIWLAKAVVRATNKKKWAIAIREGLAESPRKHRQAVARQLAREIYLEKARAAR